MVFLESGSWLGLKGMGSGMGVVMRRDPWGAGPLKMQLDGGGEGAVGIWTADLGKEEATDPCLIWKRLPFPHHLCPTPVSSDHAPDHPHPQAVALMAIWRVGDRFPNFFGGRVPLCSPELIIYSLG